MAAVCRFPWAWTASLAASLTVATWAFVGDVSEDDGSDLIIDAPNPSGPAVWAIGGLALGVAGASAARLLNRQRRLACAPGWAEPVAVAVTACIFVGFGARLVTARSGGANIGGSMFILFGVPVIVFYLAASLAGAIRYQRRSGPHRPPPWAPPPQYPSDRH